MGRDVESCVAQEEAKLERRLMEAEAERPVTGEKAAHTAGKRADMQVRSPCDGSLSFPPMCCWEFERAQMCGGVGDVWVRRRHVSRVFRSANFRAAGEKQRSTFRNRLRKQASASFVDLTVLAFSNELCIVARCDEAPCGQVRWNTEF